MTASGTVREVGRAARIHTSAERAAVTVSGVIAKQSA